MGNFHGTSKTFKWKIDGFSTLVELPSDCHYSGTFCAEGYKWRLLVYPKHTKKEDGKQYISLFLSLDTSSLQFGSVGVDAVFNLWIINQLHGKHVKRKYAGDTCLQRSQNEHGFWDMINREDFMSQSSGLLVNDSCIFGVDIIKVSTVKIRRASEVLSLLKNRTPVEYSWCIKDFSKKMTKQQNSESFSAGGHNWHLSLHTNDCTKYLSLFLELDHSPTFPPDSRVYVEFSLCLMERRNGNNKEYRCQKQYSLKDSKWGWPEFLLLKDFHDPANGFLKDDKCIVKASVTVLGSVTIDNTTTNNICPSAISPKYCPSLCQ